MLIFLDSFDHYATADLVLKWSAVVNPSTGASPAINATAGRRGGGAVVITNDGSLRKDLAGSRTLIVGFAQKISTFPTGTDPSSTIHWMTLGNADGNHLYLAVSLDGSIAAYRRDTAVTNATAYTLLGRTTGGILQAGVYAYVEVKATISAATSGSVKVLVNGVTALNLTGIKTISYASVTETVTRVLLLNPTSALGTTTTYDDLYIADNSGALNNDFFGDVRIDAVMPNAEGTYKEFTPDTGTVHYTRVNEAIADQTTYVAASSVGARDSYQFTDLASIVGVVRGVQIVDAAVKDDAGVRSIAHLSKSGVSEQYSAALPLSTDRKLYTTIQETDPATGTYWTQAGINAAEFGVTVAA